MKKQCIFTRLKVKYKFENFKFPLKKKFISEILIQIITVVFKYITLIVYDNTSSFSLVLLFYLLLISLLFIFFRVLFIHLLFPHHAVTSA